MLRSAGFAPFLVSAVIAAGAPAQIEWAAKLDPALERAAAENTIVMIAINMPGERGSDIVARDHYRDPILTELAKHTVNVLLKVGPLGTIDADERLVRERYLKVGPEDPVAAPHHLFVKPGGDGELISSVAYLLTEGQLEWIWVDSLKKVRPEFEWKLSDRARAPEGMRLDGETEKGREGDEPPTEEQVKSAISELKKSGRWGGDWEKRLRNFQIVLKSDDPAAIKYGTTSMRSAGGFGMARRALRAIGETSPEVWWTVPAEYLDDREDDTREEAVRALEQLRAKKAINPLKKAWKSEKNEAIRGRILRALAASGPADKSVSQLLGKALAKEKAPAVRAQAVAAASVLELPDAVLAHVEAGFADKDRDVRTAAAFAIASRRDAELLPVLEKAVTDEKDLEAKHWLELAVGIVGGGDLRDLDPFVEKVLGDRRERQSWDPEEMMRGRRGRGEDGGDDEGGDRPRR